MPLQTVATRQFSSGCLMGLGVSFFIAVLTIPCGTWQATAPSVARQAIAGLALKVHHISGSLVHMGRMLYRRV
eukprot:CAMPEP_0181396966 /NCGR_PEP_ID=MMETSP1110-20121109/212_1 /TAXON_ID=174948 /ORGANISM="Symbiodinium sp., Strain CCMP421" /LENGTH=72 /DNA_ID=CAMNT_0023518731 /DNA_START=843 /DNA_END=1061 /DNA_ORIENTATION=+